MRRNLFCLVLLATQWCASPAAAAEDSYEGIMTFVGGSLTEFWDNAEAIESLVVAQLGFSSTYSCANVCQFRRGVSSASWTFVVCHSCAPTTSATLRAAEILEEARYDLRVDVTTTLNESQLLTAFDDAGANIATITGTTFNGSAVGTVLTPVDPPKSSSSTDYTPTALEVVAAILAFCMLTAGIVYGATRMRNRSKQEKEFYEFREQEEQEELAAGRGNVMP
eukprot:TRINITY_DN2815_c7_g1_i1.p1 TRINITY_DN2815_c7_g1~~TRINITY_DN2815_c7_g1_i1.p1  ORF type:complete len:223 (+),score=29.58 TRINITY_DN2815_c7_g1_i1:58-726(+)